MGRAPKIFGNLVQIKPDVWQDSAFASCACAFTTSLGTAIKKQRCRQIPSWVCPVPLQISVWAVFLAFSWLGTPWKLEDANLERTGSSCAIIPSVLEECTTPRGPCRRSSLSWLCPQQGLRFCSASACLLKICTKTQKLSLFQTQWCSLLLNTKQGCPRALNQQRRADRNGWWEDKFMAFSYLETYLTLMQIFSQYSCEPVP